MFTIYAYTIIQLETYGISNLISVVSDQFSKRRYSLLIIIYNKFRGGGSTRPALPSPVKTLCIKIIETGILQSLSSKIQCAFCERIFHSYFISIMVDFNESNCKQLKSFNLNNYLYLCMYITDFFYLFNVYSLLYK